jgi:regulatory protein
MLITAIDRQKKNRSRFSVSLDGTFAFGVSDEVLLRAVLFVGKELTQAEADALTVADSEETAKQKAMRLIGIRPRTEKEISTYLLGKGYDESTAAAVTGKLIALHLIDDLEFARMFCRDRLKLKPAGTQLLRRQLAQKGVPRIIVEKVLSEFFSASAESDTAADAAGRYWTKISRNRIPADLSAAKKKMLDHLMRRGFSYETSRNAISHILRDDDE